MRGLSEEIRAKIFNSQKKPVGKTGFNSFKATPGIEPGYADLQSDA